MYIRGEHYLTCMRSGEKIRRSDAVIDGQTGMIVKSDYADPKHPNEMRLMPRKPVVPSLISPEPTDYFLTANEISESDL